MPVNGSKLQFTETNVNLSPDKPGVYVLYVDGHLIYYGSSEKSIRSRLQDHLAGREGQCTQVTDVVRLRDCLEAPEARAGTDP